MELVYGLWVPKTSSAGWIDAKRAVERQNIEGVTITFTAWKERRTFGADNAPTVRSHEYGQVYRNGIFGTDNLYRIGGAK